jgi:hypothetical protein
MAWVTPLTIEYVIFFLQFCFLFEGDLDDKGNIIKTIRYTPKVNPFDIYSEAAPVFIDQQTCKYFIIVNQTKMIQDSIRYLRFIPSPTKLRRDIVTLPSVLPQHPCEHSRINIHQWILTKLGTYLVLKRIWNPIDFQGYRSKVKVTGSNI